MPWITGYQKWLSESQSLNNAQMVANHFAASWTPNAIAALCGNMRHESSINPDMSEYGYAWGSNRGYGLVQWTPRSKYWDWAVARGLAPREGDSQLARIDYEKANRIQWIATSAYPLSFEEFTQSTADVGYLTQAFTWNYERPNRTAGINSTPDRIAFARKVLAQVDFSGSGAPGILPLWPTTPGLAISSKWGMRTLDGETREHAAIDIGGGGVEHPIFATMGGTVIHNEWNDISGWRMRIKHDDDEYISQYLHLAAKSPLAIGTKVERGERIATMGGSGGYAIHLDFAIAKQESGFFTLVGTIDPEVYLKTPSSGGTGGGGSTPTPRPVQQVSHALKPALYQYEEASPNMTYYQVKPGDTLGDIAKRYNVPLHTIMRVNYISINNVNDIKKGEMLLLPKAAKAPVKPASKPTLAPIKTHKVQAGETLGGIAKRYKTTAAAIAKKNGIKDLNKIYKGQVLVL